MSLLSLQSLLINLVLPYWIKLFISFIILIPTLNFWRVVYLYKYAVRRTLVFHSEHTAPSLLMRVSCWSSHFQFVRCRGGSSFFNTVCPITVIFIFSLILKYMLNRSLFRGVGKRIWMADFLCVSLVTTGNPDTVHFREKYSCRVQLELVCRMPVALWLSDSLSCKGFL